ncbi:MAG: hypothetical protein ACRDYB_16565 [Acidimicrobiales bacterium]
MLKVIHEDTAANDRAVACGTSLLDGVAVVLAENRADLPDLR